MKRILLLGSTGSIGEQALDVISGRTDMRVVGLSCGRRTQLLLEQAVSMGVQDVAIAEEAAAADVSSSLYPDLSMHSGPGAAARLVREVEADLVLNAIVGFAGLEATVAALECGRPLALANKESLVSGGSFVTRLAAGRGITILPVDSEHSALFQLLSGEEKAAIESLVITASGGPFRGRTAAELAAVTPDEALSHPTWSMGAKITVDSATLMNKGLEIIEAHHLFGVSYERIEVVIHPQSVVHSLVRLVDASLLAHLGLPDMRVPIAYALNYPERRPVGGVLPLDLAQTGRLEFSAPDTDTFPCLALAREAGRAGDAATCALNAANEVAVRAFLARSLPFVGIAAVVEEVLERIASEPQPLSYEDIVEIDTRARREAERVCREQGN